MSILSPILVKKIQPKLAKASTYVRELFAVTQAVSKWRHYLLGHHFMIITDHQSLKDILTQPIHTPDQQKYLVKLLGYDFDILYKAGNTNIVADALSREFANPTFTESSFTLLQPPLLRYFNSLPI